MQAEKFYYYQNLLTESCKNPQGSVEHTLENAVQCKISVRDVLRCKSCNETRIWDMLHGIYLNINQLDAL